MGAKKCGNWLIPVQLAIVVQCEKHIQHEKHALSRGLGAYSNRKF